MYGRDMKIRGRREWKRCLGSSDQSQQLSGGLQFAKYVFDTQGASTSAATFTAHCVVLDALAPSGRAVLVMFDQKCH